HREHPSGGADRLDIFLDHQLDGVADRLQYAVRTDAHRPQPRLRPRNDLPLEQHHVGYPHERCVEDDEDLQQRDDEVVDHLLILSWGPTPTTCAFAAHAARLWFHRLSAFTTTLSPANPATCAFAAHAARPCFHRLSTFPPTLPPAHPSPCPL